MNGDKDDMEDAAPRELTSPGQLPDLDGEELLLSWDQEDADTIIRHGERVVWREMTGWEVYERFEEIAALLQQRYGRRLKDLVPTARSRYALLGDSSRASAHVEAARALIRECSGGADRMPAEPAKEPGNMAEEQNAAFTEAREPETPGPLAEWYRIRCDEHGVWFGATPPGGETWSEKFAWGDIVRVCYLTGGLFESDELYVFTAGRHESFVIPTEADGGRHLVEALIRRGLFSADLMRDAVATEGALFCWPPAGTEDDIGE